MDYHARHLRTNAGGGGGGGDSFRSIEGHAPLVSQKCSQKMTVSIREYRSTNYLISPSSQLNGDA